MAALKLEKDGVYLLKPTKIKRTEKMVKSQKFGGMCRRYDITFVDKNAEVVECEWLCCGEDNTEFVEGVPRYIKVSWISGQGSATIEPCEEPGSKPSSYTQKKEEQKHIDIIDTNQTPVINPFNINVSGKASTFAYAYAKDLKVAEITARGWNAKVTPEDIEDIISWGGKIAIGLTNQLDF